MPDWRAWMAALGGRVRRVREVLGLSQEQLARLAGVSQGAISRLEVARGLGTPLLVVVKVQAALAAGLRALGSAIPTEAQDALSLPPLDGATPTVPPITRDPALDELLRLWHALPERQRATALAVLRALAADAHQGEAAKAGK